MKKKNDLIRWIAALLVYLKIQLLVHRSRLNKDWSLCCENMGNSKFPHKRKALPSSEISSVIKQTGSTWTHKVPLSPVPLFSAYLTSEKWCWNVRVIPPGLKGRGGDEMCCRARFVVACPFAGAAVSAMLRLHGRSSSLHLEELFKQTWWRRLFRWKECGCWLIFGEVEGDGSWCSGGSVRAKWPEWIQKVKQRHVLYVFFFS